LVCGLRPAVQPGPGLTNQPSKCAAQHDCNKDHDPILAWSMILARNSVLYNYKRKIEVGPRQQPAEPEQGKRLGSAETDAIEPKQE
jgi:hypothetical protein